MTLGKANITYHEVNDIVNLGKYYVMWRNRKNIEEMASDDSNIPKHELKKKIGKINFFMETVLENIYTDTTIIGMRPDQNSPIVVGDGIHRAIGIFKAYLKENSIKNRVTLRLLLIEGQHIAYLEDYKLSINNSS